ncbi:hypothetical protein IOLA_077 [uncultured bacterium]|nr:hypothetical protein IOLA_077 [uncultured bacterium]
MKKIKNNKILYKLSMPRLSNIMNTNIDNLSNLLKPDIDSEKRNKIEALIKFGRDINLNLKRYAVGDVKYSMSINVKKINNKSLINAIINQVLTFLMSTISIKSMLLQKSSN